MTSPSVSVCIPTYNQIKYLPKVLESVFSQTWKDVEVIISDDSTTDEVKNFIEEFALRYPNLIYVRHTPSLGAPQNWNYLHQIAKGRYIKYMHHDDWFAHDNALEWMVSALEENGADFVFSASTAHYMNHHFERYNYPSEENKIMFFKDPTMLILCNHVSNPSVILFRKDDKILFDPEMKWFVDVDFYIQYLLKHGKIVGVSKPLVSVVAFDEHNISNSCVENKEVEIGEYHRMIKKYGRYSLNKAALWKHYLSVISAYKITRVHEYKKYIGDRRVNLGMILFIKYIHLREFLVWKITQSKRFLKANSLKNV